MTNEAHDTRRMTYHAKQVVNAVLVQWYKNNMMAVDTICMLSEVFGAKKHSGVVALRRDLIKFIRRTIRCRHKRNRTGLSSLEVAFESTVGGPDEGWKMPSLKLIGTMTGLHHTSVMMYDKRGENDAGATAERGRDDQDRRGRAVDPGRPAQIQMSSLPAVRQMRHS